MFWRKTQVVAVAQSSFLSAQNTNVAHIVIGENGVGKMVKGKEWRFIFL